MEPNLLDVLGVFVAPVAAVSITFRCPLETLPLSFSVCAARFCNVLCFQIDEDVFLLYLFCPLACVFLSCSVLSSQGHRTDECFWLNDCKKLDTNLFGG